MPEQSEGVRTVAVAGGSLAGLSAVRALRARGFDGRVVVAGGEQHAPYDRPPLSKAFLAGTVAVADLALTGEDEQLDVEWRPGVRATALRATRRTLELSDGTDLEVDGVVLATGARPRVPWRDLPAGVHVLRSLDDALALRADLVPGARLVVVGAGFIGAEVASTASGLGLDVTVIEAATVPLGAALGADMGAAIAGLHAEHGVRLRAGVAVTGFAAAPGSSAATSSATQPGSSAATSSATPPGSFATTGRVTGVHLADGSTVPADVVVLGLGVVPEVDWLAGSGLALAGPVRGGSGGARGVRCDAYGGTGLPTVVAVGDCATWYDPQLGTHHRLEHWSAARERASVAVSTLLSAGTVRSRTRPPYFWSDQYGLRLQVAGHTYGADTVTVEDGSVAGRDFLAVYRRGGVPVAVLAVGRTREFTRWRKSLAARAAGQVGTVVA